MKRALARGRIFPQSYSTDRRYGRLSLKACALFPLIWVNADDQGRLCGDPEEVKYACCPNIDHITKADVPQILRELEQNQLIKIYDTPRSAAIQLLDWWNVQKPQWAWPSEYPPFEGWQDRLRYKRGAKTVVTENWLSGESRDDAQVNEEKASGNDESSVQVRTGKGGSGEAQNPVQVNSETLSGEGTERAHAGTKDGSPETSKHTQVNSLVSETVREKVLARAGPHPTPPLETERGIVREKEREKGNSPEDSGENSGETQEGAQVSTLVAKKPPDPFTQARKQVFEGLKERRGYNSPQAGAEAQAITWMLKQGYVVEQILGAYDKLKQDEFWRDKLLNMQSVKAQVGEIFRERRQHAQQESRTGERRQRTQPIRSYEWQEAPDEPDDTS